MGPAAVSSCVQAQLTRAMRHVLTKPVWWRSTGYGYSKAKLANNIEATLIPGSLDRGSSVSVSKGSYGKGKQLDVFALENWHFIQSIRPVNPRKTISMKVGDKNIDVGPEQYAKKMVEKYTGNAKTRG